MQRNISEQFPLHLISVQCQSAKAMYLYICIYVYMYLKYIGAILTAFDSGAMPKWWDLV